VLPIENASLDVRSDDGRYRDPELNAEPEQEEQAPVTTLLSLAAERMAAHLAPNAYTYPGGCGMPLNCLHPCRGLQGIMSKASGRGAGEDRGRK
jgi:hypothetical protein